MLNRTATSCQSYNAGSLMQYKFVFKAGSRIAGLLPRARLQHRSSYAAPVATWTPPTDPSSTPDVPPEFTPPDQQPGSYPRAPPEFVPPEQSPPGPTQPAERPGRIARPEVPDPEKDPMRSPDRRREINEPEPDTEPAPLPDRE